MAVSLYNKKIEIYDLLAGINKVNTDLFYMLLHFNYIKKQTSLKGHKNYAMVLVLKSKKYLYSGGDDQAVILWNIQTQEILQKIGKN